MKKLLFLSLFFVGCSDREVKKMIIEPNPPTMVESPVDCAIHFERNQSLKQIAYRATLMADICGYSADQIKTSAELELR